MAETPTLPRGRRPGRPDDAKALPEHVTVPLLALITQRSLDADYEHVAARRRASSQTPSARPVPRRTAGMVLLVFGLLVTVAAVQTSRNASASDASRDSLIKQVNLRRQGLTDLQQQLSRVDGRVLDLQAQLSSLSSADKATATRTRGLEASTGFGAVRGPGVQVTVNSAPGSAGTQLVRDSDLTLLSDALWAAGAEAISVNGQRLTALGAFRNVGTGILLNSQPVNPPYVFQVVGDPDSLPANLLSSSIGEKWYALKESLGFRFDVHNGGTMTLPAAAPQRLRSAQVATPQNGHAPTQLEESAP
ncbi:MAG TPA: DUF881 domain-containing protein [Nocardioides sp.]|jgi:uncharacterized protein YlxW (UPF0749 family)|nr:DUF881 domain-containing protein [Nocardioides sp.]